MLYARNVRSKIREPSRLRPNMLRLLLILLMIAQVSACPFVCASRAEMCEDQQQVVKSGCRCCQPKQVEPASPAPPKTPSQSDECRCFCSAEFQHSTEQPFGDLDLCLSSTVLFAEAWCAESLSTSVARLLPDDPGKPPGRQLRVTLQTLLI